MKGEFVELSHFFALNDHRINRCMLQDGLNASDNPVVIFNDAQVSRVLFSGDLKSIGNKVGLSPPICPRPLEAASL